MVTEERPKWKEVMGGRGTTRDCFENGHSMRKIALSIPFLSVYCAMCTFDIIYYYSIDSIQQVFIEFLHVPDWVLII